MKRRLFLAAGCACAAALLAGAARAQQGSSWHMPSRFVRPDLATDEGGLWAMMDRAERQLRRSPFLVRDKALHDYIESIACRLGKDHCPDIRVYIVRTPLFNASMAPNGMLQVWTGLLLRMDNEAQLAAVLGHEIGHYVERHSVERLRDTKTSAAFGTFLGLAGVAGAVGQLALLAGMFSYSRDQEREADRIGVQLMEESGYQPAEAAKVWGNLVEEVKARPGGASGAVPMFATHPDAEERRETLAAMAAGMPQGATNARAWRDNVLPYRWDWLMLEVRRGQHEESIALLGRMIAAEPEDAELRTARGEVYRLRGKEGDSDLALADYQAAIALGREPAEAHRGLAMIHRARGEPAAARADFERYLRAAPTAPDAPMIRSYVEELAK